MFATFTYGNNSHKRPLLLALVLIAPAFACNGATFTSNKPDAGDDGDTDAEEIVIANPNIGDENSTDADFDATTTRTPAMPEAGDAGATADAFDADTMVTCSSSSLSCDGGCVPNSVHNCGACGLSCTPPDGGLAACTLTDAGAYACTTSCTASAPSCGGVCTPKSDFQTDSNNCGACGHSCQGGTCGAGNCNPWAVPATVTGGINYLATDGTSIGWLDANQMSVWTVATGGGTPLKVDASLSSGFHAFLSMASTSLAWADVSFATSESVYVGQTTAGTTQSGTDTPVDNVNMGTPGGIAMDASGKYAYVSENITLDQGQSAMVWRCVLQATPTCTTLLTLNANANNLVANANYLVYATSDNRVFGYQLPSGPLSLLATESTDANLKTTAIDSAYAYWAVSDGTTVTIKRTPLASPPSNPEIVVSDFLGNVDSIATDGTNVYFAANTMPDASTGSALLAYAPVAGGSGGSTPSAPVSLWAGETVSNLAVGGGYIFFYEEAANAIYRLATP